MYKFWQSMIVHSVAAFFLSSCFVMHAPDPEDRQRALQLVDQGVVLMRQGDLIRAEATFQLAQELANLPAALDGLGCIALLQGENELAEGLFNRALDLDLRYTEAVGNLALLYEQMGQPKRAEKHFRQAIRLDPSNFRIRNNYAIFLAQKPNSRVALAKDQLLKASVLMETPIVEANMIELSKRGEILWHK